MKKSQKKSASVKVNFNLPDSTFAKLVKGAALKKMPFDSFLLFLLQGEDTPKKEKAPSSL